MPYKLVEETQAQTGRSFYGRGGRNPNRTASTSTVEHAVWRCVSCRALAVGPKYQEPPKKCAKCGH